MLLTASKADGTGDTSPPSPRAISSSSGTRIFIRRGAPQFLDRRAAGLGFQAPLLGRGGRFGRPARYRRGHGAADQRNQPFQRILPVALLRAVALGGYDEDAVPREPPPRQTGQPTAHILGE